MDIQAQYEKDLEELKRLEGQEIPEEEIVEEDVEEPEEVTQEEEVEEPVKQEVELVDPPKDHKAWAEQRREMAALKRKLAELEAKKEAPQEVIVDQEPNKEEEPIAWLEWNNRQLRNELEGLKKETVPEIRRRQEQERKAQAAAEFTEYENRFKARTADYEAVGAHAISQLKRSYQNLNPGMSETRLNEAVADHILGIAAQAARDGLDPAEEVYHTFRNQFGVPRMEEPREDKKAVSLASIDKSRRKSASPLVGGGQGGSIPLTIKSAVTDMTNGEFAALSPSQLRELESQLR